MDAEEKLVKLISYLMSVRKLSQKNENFGAKSLKEFQIK
jgi:hypothetical protein